MYLDFYKLSAKPFQISTDPRFLWLGEKHKEALAVLKYGILDNKGFLLLTGDVGTGKTTLLNALVESLDDTVLVAMVTDPGLAKMDFFNFVADSFEMHRSFKSKGEFLIFLRNYLLDLHKQNRQALLIIDECQHLNQKMLEEVRLLSNIEKSNTKLINIFFVGQNEFNEIILRPRNRAIRQRITINYNIDALTASETEDYIRFRLETAGSAEQLFTRKAINAVYAFSNGYPRLINIICDQALLTGYVKEKRHIDDKIVAECAHELKIGRNLPTARSLAIPDAVAPSSQKSTAEQHVTPAPMPAASRQMTVNRWLVIALIVVLIIWSGLVTAYYFTQHRNAFAPGAVFGTDRGDQGAVTAGAQETRQPEHRAAGDRPSNADGEAIGGERAGAVQASTHAAAPADASSASAPIDGGNLVAPSSVAPAGEVTRQAPAAAAAEAVTLEMIEARYGATPEVFFGFNANTFETDAYPMLQMIARYCLQHPGASLVLRGYSDNMGVRAYNIKLSEFRADMVKTYLVGRGVPDGAVKTMAMGPVEGGASTESMRKVVIELVPPA